MHHRKKERLSALLAKSAAKPRGEPAARKQPRAARRPQDKLAGAQFRWLNEQLYTTDGADAKRLFDEKPSLFKLYHDGFRQQAAQWPVNPVDVLISELKGAKAGTVVADLGCGDAQIARTLGRAAGGPHDVHSFDLWQPADAAGSKLVTRCDISHVPLASGVCDVAVFCLSLMGTNWLEYIREARRILRAGAKLRIVEVVSRISDSAAFVRAVEACGFRLDSQRRFGTMFISFSLSVSDSLGSGGSKLDVSQLLKPCLYKRR